MAQDEENLHSIVARSLSPRPPHLSYGGSQSSPTVQLSFTNKAIPERKAAKGETPVSAMALLKHVQEEDEETSAVDATRRPRGGRRQKAPAGDVQSTLERDRYYLKMGIVNTHSPDSPHRLFDFGGGEEEEEEEKMRREKRSEDARRSSTMDIRTSAALKRPSPELRSTRPVSYSSDMRFGGVLRSRTVHGSISLDEQGLPPGHSNGLRVSVSEDKLSPPVSRRAEPPVGGPSAQYQWRQKSPNPDVKQSSPPITLRGKSRVSSGSASSPDSGYGNTPENGTGGSTVEKEGEGEGEGGRQLAKRRADLERDPGECSSVFISGSPSRGALPLEPAGLTHSNPKQPSTVGSDAGSAGPTTVALHSSSGNSHRHSSTLVSASKLSGSSPELFSSRGFLSHSSANSEEETTRLAVVGEGLSHSQSAVNIPKDFFSREQDEEGRTAASSVHPSPPSHHPLHHSHTPTPTLLTEAPRLPLTLEEGSMTPSFLVESPKSHTLPGGGGEVKFRARKGHVNHQEKVDAMLARRRHRSMSQPLIRSELKASSSATLPAITTTPDEKDYFQVTDDLAKENSHFSLSEALLTIIEQYKANCREQFLEETHPLPSPPEAHGEDIADYHAALTQQDSMSTHSSPLEGGGRGGGEGLYGSSWESEGSSLSLAEDLPPSPRHSRPRVSFLELIQSRSGDNSAESTAQRLLQYMAACLTGNHGTELSMSQMVLQLPTDFLNSLQMDEDLQKSVTTSSAHMRGNREWAPPRSQIIFHIKTASRDIQKSLSSQRYRCTGCGMKVDPAHARHFRFCNYTGKYFCMNCHTNATCVIPAHIIARWSFKRLYVSNFARDLLARIHHEPVFNVLNVNKQIYSKVPVMAQAKELRTQLISVKQYIRTCRRAQNLNLTFEGYAPWTTELHLYSVDDLIQLRTGVKMRYLKALLADSIQHVKTCPICMGKGFVCEFCKDSTDILYPFEIQRVGICTTCQCCFHKDCFVRECPRCFRVQERQKQRLAKITFELAEEEEEEEEGEGSQDEHPS